MRANDQRELIEELLGITELSRKAEALKEVIKETKDEIKDEEYNLKAKEDANSRILKSIKILNVDNVSGKKNTILNYKNYKMVLIVFHMLISNKKSLIIRH